VALVRSRGTTGVPDSCAAGVALPWTLTRHSGGVPRFTLVILSVAKDPYYSSIRCAQGAPTYLDGAEPGLSEVEWAFRPALNRRVEGGFSPCGELQKKKAGLVPGFEFA
jgi:hypothetical protein